MRLAAKRFQNRVSKEIGRELLVRANSPLYQAWADRICMIKRRDGHEDSGHVFIKPITR